MFLQMSIAFRTHQVTKYTLSLMRALWGRMKMPPYDWRFSPIGCWNAVAYMELTNRYRGLNWSLPRMVLTVAFGDEDANSRYDCSIQRRGAICTTTVGVFLVRCKEWKVWLLRWMFTGAGWDIISVVCLRVVYQTHKRLVWNNIRDRSFETETKTETVCIKTKTKTLALKTKTETSTAKIRSRVLSRPRPESRGLHPCIPSTNFVHHLSDCHHHHIIHHFLSLPFNTNSPVSPVPQILPTVPTGLSTGLQPDCLHGLRTTLRYVLVLMLSSFSWRVCMTKLAFS